MYRYLRNYRNESAVRISRRPAPPLTLLAAVGEKCDYNDHVRKGQRYVMRDLKDRHEGESEKTRYLLNLD